MSDEIKKFTMALFQRLSMLSLLLEQCRQLYSSKEDVSILNDTAGLFFRVVQEQFMDSILFGISNITGSEKTFGHSNLTIRALPNKIVDEALKAEVKVLCDKAIEEASFAEKHRNKRIAHFDEVFHLNSTELTECDIATFQKVEKALNAVHSVLNIVSMRCFNNFLDKQFIWPRGSANELVATLKNCAKASVQANRQSI